MLETSWVGEATISDLDILQSVLLYKSAFFNASYVHYEDCLIGRLKLLPDQASQYYLKKDFRSMQAAQMFLKDPPQFDEIMTSLHQLELAVNQKISSP